MKKTSVFDVFLDEEEEISRAVDRGDLKSISSLNDELIRAIFNFLCPNRKMTFRL